MELIGGPEKRDIVLVGYSDDWPDQFELHASTIRQALGSGAHRIDHIGSTSIPGMVAKPIIDIQLSVADTEDEASYVPKLESAGYELRVREPGHRMLRAPELSAHIHVCPSGSAWERRHLLFRDWLRHNKDDFTAYKELKQKLAKQDWETMNHYADAKGGLISEIMKRAEQWAVESRWEL